MVYVNSKKFACEACIKGHRSSSCHHTDRPLFEIKKKGRPVSQCTKCRELRQSKRVHSKCTCNLTDNSPTSEQLVKVLSGTKSRFVPIVPALPNGLKDVLQASSVPSSMPADARQQVASLLNPCRCKSVWSCKCRTLNTSSSKHTGNLDALALAASMCCGETSTSASVSSGSKRQSTPPSSPTNKRWNHGKSDGPPTALGPELPPIYLDVDPAPLALSFPPLSTIASIAGTGCTCGVQCGCPGCIEHRGAEHASKDRRDCADGCGTCIDHRTGIALPNSGAEPNFLDRFFARAAALPEPPANRNRGIGVELDPMNVIVYPDAVRDVGECGVAFGLVSVPKLDGRCGRPGGTCGCGKSCSGRCHDHGDEHGTGEQAIPGSPPSPQTAPMAESTPLLRSCCADKRTEVSI